MWRQSSEIRRGALGLCPCHVSAMPFQTCFTAISVCHQMPNRTIDLSEYMNSISSCNQFGDEFGDEQAFVRCQIIHQISLALSDASGPNHSGPSVGISRASQQHLLDSHIKLTLCTLIKSCINAAKQHSISTAPGYQSAQLESHLASWCSSLLILSHRSYAHLY